MLLRRFMLPLLLASVVLSGCAKSAQQYFDSGNRYLAQGKYNEAAIEFQNAVQQDSKFGDAHLKLGETFARLEDWSSALHEYVNAADLMPANKDAQLKAGSILMLVRRYEDARARAEKVLKMDPKNLEAQLLRANATFAMNDLDGAIRQVEEAIQLDPTAARAYSLLGTIEAHQGDVAAAEKALRQAVEIDPKSVLGHLALGQFLAGQQRPNEAESSFKQAYTIDPKNARAARALATFYMASNRAPEAEPYFKSLAKNSPDPAPTLELADYYVAMRRPEDAIAILTKAAARKEGGADATVRLAAIEYEQGKTAEAHKLIDDLLARNARNSQALLVKARFLMREKKLDAALARAKAAVAVAPRSVPGQYLLGTLYAAAKRPDEAIAAFTEVLRLNPRAVVAQAQLAQLQMMNGESASALQSAQAASAAAPNNALLRLLLARTLTANGDVTQAEAVLKGLEAQFPKSADVQSAKGSMLLVKHDPAGARQAFDKALALDPNSNEALAGLLTLDAAAKHLPEAKARVDARLARTPDDPVVLVLAARTYATAGDLAKAEQTLLKALEVAPDTLEAYGVLGQLYLSQRKLPAAREKFAELAKRQSKPTAAETMVAMILQMEGKNAEAQKQYERVMANDPRAAVAANNLAWIYVESGGNLDVALQLAQTAKSQLPDQPEINDTLGWIYYKKGLTELAVEPLSQAVGKGPKVATYQFHLGMALAKNGETDKARTALQAALAIDPKFAGADEARKTLASLK